MKIPVHFFPCVQGLSHAISMVHFDKNQEFLPGHPNCQVMNQSPVLSSYSEAGLIDVFPLHDDEELEKLHAVWFKSGFMALLRPPIAEIRSYFGENVALYISFTSFYTLFLVPMAFFGTIHFVLDYFFRVDFIYNNLLFACFNLASLTIFCELWKRNSNVLSFQFGTMGKLRHKKPRPAFRGEYGLNPVTGKAEVQYPIKKTIQTLALISLPVTTVCLVIAFIMMLLSFESEKWMAEWIGNDNADGLLNQGLAFAPSITYTVLLLMVNLKYTHLAHWLTELENHRTQEQFERHVVAKMVLFEFVNTFLALFYIAFYLQDMAMLKSQIGIQLVVISLVNQLQGTALPILLKIPSSKKVMNKIAKKTTSAAAKNGKKSVVIKHHQVKCIENMVSDTDINVRRGLSSLDKDPHDSLFYQDYLEFWLQFGHVFLFSSVYPLAAFLALLHNLFELKMDAYKLCRIMRKPMPRGIRDIGAWYTAFSLTSLISIMTNLALLSMDRDVQAFAPNASSRDWILLFVFFEHIFLLIREIIDKVIPDVPSHIKLAMDINDFKLKSK